MASAFKYRFDQQNHPASQKNGDFMEGSESTIGKNVKSAREALNWKQLELAERSNLPRSTISKIESGCITNIKHLDSIAHSFRIPSYFLLLRSIDFKNMSYIIASSENIKKYISSKEKIDYSLFEKVVMKSSSNNKNDIKEALSIIDVVVERVFDINPPIKNSNENFEFRTKRIASTAISSKSYPQNSVINGIISHILTKA